jgi:hypothetical protein
VTRETLKIPDAKKYLDFVGINYTQEQLEMTREFFDIVSILDSIDGVEKAMEAGTCMTEKEYFGKLESGEGVPVVCCIKWDREENPYSYVFRGDFAIFWQEIKAALGKDGFGF